MLTVLRGVIGLKLAVRGDGDVERRMRLDWDPPACLSSLPTEYVVSVTSLDGFAVICSMATPSSHLCRCGTIFPASKSSKVIDKPVLSSSSSLPDTVSTPSGAVDEFDPSTSVHASDVELDIFVSFELTDKDTQHGVLSTVAGIFSGWLASAKISFSEDKRLDNTVSLAFRKKIAVCRRYIEVK